jgi:hypothetical protein
MKNQNKVPVMKTKIISKEDLIDAVDAISEYTDDLSARLVHMEDRNKMFALILEEVDHMIVRMNGPSTHYRDELREIAEKNGIVMSPTE